MAVEIETVYNNLSELLVDICIFLSDKDNYNALLPEARQRADLLITRSKAQIIKITKSPKNQEELSESYVDMKSRPEPPEMIDSEIYSSVEEGTDHEEIKRYTDLPAKNLSQEVKFGHLYMKIKIILNFEKIRKVYGGIHDNYLLIYGNEKDVKPIRSFDLDVYSANHVINNKHGLNSLEFKISDESNKKPIHFVALTYNDLLQWLAYINRTNNPKNVEENEIVGGCSHSHNMKNNNVETLKLPNLPSRTGGLHMRRKNNAPLPPIPPTIALKTFSPNKSCRVSSESEHSVASYDDLITNQGDSKSFSENDDEHTYEIFLVKTEKT